MLWILICFGTSRDCVFYGRMNAFCLANAQDAFVIDMNALVTIQVISNPSIPLLWMCLVDLNDLFCKQAIFSLSFTEFASLPFVIGTA